MKSGYPVSMGLPNACMLPELFAVLSGAALPTHPGMIESPPLVEPMPPPPPNARGHLLQTLPQHMDSQHFCVTWDTGSTTEEVAAHTLDALEQAWMGLVARDGWTPPYSSDQWLISVMLDPSLEGTGFTGQYTDETTSVVYPYIWINPTYEHMTNFYESLAAHEFSHALQWRLRPLANGWEEAWYWEASAEWSAELARPELNAYAAQSYYYALHPEYRYSSMDDYHQYGMFLVNAFLEQYRTGEHGTRATWLLGEQRPEESWNTLIPEIAEDTLENFWAEMTTRIAQQELAESDLYERPVRFDILQDGQGGSLDFLGTHYWKSRVDAWVQSEGDVILASPSNIGDVVEVLDGDWLTVTGLADGLAPYTLKFTSEPDTGSSDTAASNEEPYLGCGCASSTAQSRVHWLLLMLVGLLHTRRQPQGLLDEPRATMPDLSC